MNIIDSILLATDFSVDARNALTFALEIATEFEASLHLLHSIEEPYDIAPLIDKAKQALGRRVEQVLDDLRADIKEEKRFQELDIHTEILTGRAVYAILEEPDSRDFDLIVMGTKGRTGLERVFWGSTTAETIKQSNVPVLTVPKDSEYKKFEKILFATDYQDADLEGLQFITAFASQFNASVDVFHVSENNTLKSNCLFRGFKELATEATFYDKLEFVQHNGTSFIEGMLSHLEDANADLLTMIHYQNSFSIFRKKHSQKMSANTTIPLLIMPDSSLMKNVNSP